MLIVVVLALGAGYFIINALRRPKFMVPKIAPRYLIVCPKHADRIQDNQVALVDSKRCIFCIDMAA